MEKATGNHIIDTMTDEFTLVGKPKHFKNYKLNVLSWILSISLLKLRTRPARENLTQIGTNRKCRKSRFFHNR